MKRTVLTSIIGLATWSLIAGYAHAQSPSSHQPSYMPNPEYAMLAYSYAGPADLNSGGEYSRHDVAYHGEIPLLMDDPLRFAMFGDLRWSHIALDKSSVGDVDVYKFFGTLDMRYEGLYPFVVLGQAGVGLLSDLKEIDSNDARMRGRAVVEYPLSDALALRAGAAFDEALGDDEWHWVGGFRWEPGPKWRLNLQYPRSEIAFSPVRGTAFSLQAGYVGDNWAIFYDEQEYNLRIKGFSTHAAAEFALNEMTWIRIFGGWLTERTVDIWKGERRPVKAEADDGYFTGIALLWR